MACLIVVFDRIAGPSLTFAYGFSYWFRSKQFLVRFFLYFTFPSLRRMPVTFSELPWEQ